MKQGKDQHKKKLAELLNTENIAEYLRKLFNTYLETQKNCACVLSDGDLTSARTFEKNRQSLKAEIEQIQYSIT